MKLILAFLIIIMLSLILPVPTLAMDNAYVRIVYNTRGLQDYDLHWNDRFPPGSTIKIYAEADGINHKREVAVDYVFIIRDSDDNIVDTASFSNRYEDYRENDFVTYSKEIPAGWEDGVYTAEIHIFDLLSDSIMENYYINVSTEFLNGTKPDLPIMDRSDVFNKSDVAELYTKIVKTFYVDRYASKYP